MDYSVLKKRYAGLDILRIISAAVVCMFHTTIHLDCNYGFLQGISRSGSVFMTAFFVLSGFTIFANWGGKNLTNISSIKEFYIKRLINICPIYLVAALLYDVEHILVRGQSIIKTLLLAPIEVLGIQSFYNTLFSQSHNSGTWFISCILFCYALYPYFQHIITNISGKTKLKLLFLLSSILVYSPIICIVFDISSIYTNPIFRCMEFVIGMLLAAIKVDYCNSPILKNIYTYKICYFSTLIMSVGVSLAVKLNFYVGNAMLYSLICLPCFCIIILGLSGLNFSIIKDSKLLNKLSDISYVFFLAQLFSNDICKFILLKINITSNLIRIVMGWTSCIMIALFLRFLELFINKYVKSNVYKEKDKIL